jgi:hypothetical protein
MYYGGGSYNSSNELMELLHNVEHDWPKESADVVFDGMLVNTTGEEGKNSVFPERKSAKHIS